MSPALFAAAPQGIGGCLPGGTLPADTRCPPLVQPELPTPVAQAKARYDLPADMNLTMTVPKAAEAVAQEGAPSDAEDAALDPKKSRFPSGFEQRNDAESFASTLLQRKHRGAAPFRRRT